MRSTLSEMKEPVVSSTQSGSEPSAQPLNSTTIVRKTQPWIVLSLCSAVLLAGTIQQLLPHEPATPNFAAPDWIPFAAALFAIAGVIQWSQSLMIRLKSPLMWTGLLLMIWTANGLPFDLLHMTQLMPSPIDWPGVATRLFALAAVIFLLRIALVRPAIVSEAHVATWYGYAAFALALPYPVIRTIWAFGGMTGLTIPGSGGVGFIPWLACIPWLLAAVLSLLLVSKRQPLPRRLVLTGGWIATAIVGMIGPTAVWAMILHLVKGIGEDVPGMAFWVPCLFYGSWFLWAIAAFAATRAYQLRSSKG